MAFTNLLDLTETIEKHEVTREDGAGEAIEVVFNRRGENSTVQTRAFVGSLKRQNQKTHEMEDIRVFYSVELPKKPNYGDLVKYSGETFKIVSSVNNEGFSTLYDIETEANVIYGGNKFGY